MGLKRLQSTCWSKLSNVAFDVPWDPGDLTRVNVKEVCVQWSAEVVIGSLQMQFSYDGETWIDFEDPVPVAGSGHKIWFFGRHVPFGRVVYTHTSGQLDEVSIFGTYLPYGDR